MSIFREPGEAFPVSADDVRNPDWIADDVVRHGDAAEEYQFCFDFRSGADADSAVAALRSEGATLVRKDSDQRVIIVAHVQSIRGLAALALRMGREYGKRSPRV